MAKHYVAMDEARFFFSRGICQWLETLKSDCQAYLVENAGCREGRYDSRKYSILTNTLIEHFTTLPERFREELEFRQLTRISPQRQIQN